MTSVAEKPVGVSAERQPGLPAGEGRSVHHGSQSPLRGASVPSMAWAGRFQMT